MNPNYNETITVYNCIRGKDNPSKKDVWIRTVLHDCFYKSSITRSDGGVTRSGNGKIAKMENTYTARIPESDQYTPYRDFVKLSAEERNGLFTFDLGDIVVRGECLEEITGQTPNTASEVLDRLKPEAFLVTAFSDNTSHPCAKHYRVGG